MKRDIRVGSKVTHRLSKWKGIVLRVDGWGGYDERSRQYLHNTLHVRFWDGKEFVRLDVLDDEVTFVQKN